MNKKIIHAGKEYELRGKRVGRGYEAAVFYDNKQIGQPLFASLEDVGKNRTQHADQSLEALFCDLEEQIVSGEMRA